MKHACILCGLLVAALACYVAGFGLGVTGLLAAGVVLELTFWILALTNRSTSAGSEGSADTR